MDKEPIKGNEVSIITNNIEPDKRTITDLNVFRIKFRPELFAASIMSFRKLFSVTGFNLVLLIN